MRSLVVLDGRVLAKATGAQETALWMATRVLSRAIAVLETASEDAKAN